MAELKDKTDWEKYRQQQAGGFQWNDLTSQPHLTQIIQQLLTLMNQNDQQSRPPRQYHQGGNRNYNQNRNNQHRNNQGPNMGGMQQPRPQGMPQPNPQGMPQPGMPQPGMPQPGMPQPGMPQQMRPGPPQPPMQAGPAGTYVQSAFKLLPSVTEKNPYLKEQVGHLIYDFVQGIIGVDKAPKITGMLIELPVAQIKEYL